VGGKIAVRRSPARGPPALMRGCSFRRMSAVLIAGPMSRVESNRTAKLFANSNLPARRGPAQTRGGQALSAGRWFECAGDALIGRLHAGKLRFAGPESIRSGGRDSAII